VNTGGQFTILRKGKYELWLKGDVCNILENDSYSHGMGRGMMYLSKAKVHPNPWVIGLFGPIVGRWFSLKANKFLSYDPRFSL
jgi:hypothetical protein